MRLLFGSLARAVLAIVCIAVTFSTLEQTALGADAGNDKSREFSAQLRLKRGELVALRASAVKFLELGEAVPVTLRLPTKEGTAEFQLLPNSDTQGADFQAVTVGKKGTKLAKNRMVSFKSTTPGNDFIRLTVVVTERGKIKKRVRAFMRSKGALYNIRPSSEQFSVGESGDADTVDLAVNELSQEKTKALFEMCGVVVGDQHHRSDAELLDLAFRASTTASAQQMQEVTLATEADYEFYTYYRRNHSWTEDDVNEYMFSVIDGVNAVYAPLGIRLKIGFQRTWTVSNDPYANNKHDTALYELTDYWNSKTTVETVPARARTATFPGMVQLFSAKDWGYGDCRNGCVIGIAWMSSICPRGYSVVRNLTNIDYEVILSAHELGHNFSMPHVNNTGSIMNPYVCSTCNTFDSSSRQKAADFVALVNGSRGVPGCFSSGGVNPTNYSIGGSIVDSSGRPVAGIVVDGGSLGQAQSGSDGRFSFDNISSGTAYVITPSAGGGTFAPVDARGTVQDRSLNHSFVFTRSAGAYRISGAIRKSDGRRDAVVGALVRLVDHYSGSTSETTTDIKGNYLFDALAPGGYTLDARGVAGCVITPRTRDGSGELTISRRNKRLNFKAECN